MLSAANRDKAENMAITLDNFPIRSLRYLLFAKLLNSIELQKYERATLKI